LVRIKEVASEVTVTKQLVWYLTHPTSVCSLKAGSNPSTPEEKFWVFAITHESGYYSELN